MKSSASPLMLSRYLELDLFSVVLSHFKPCDVMSSQHISLSFPFFLSTPSIPKCRTVLVLYKSNFFNFNQVYLKIY